MNCTAVPLQSPVSRSAHWVEMDKNNEPQRGSTMNQAQGILEIICGTPLGFNHRGICTPACATRRWALEFNAVGVKPTCLNRLIGTINGLYYSLRSGLEWTKNNEPQLGSAMNLTKFVASELRSSTGASFLSAVEKHPFGRLF